MSDWKTSIVRISNKEKHPNADTLSIFSLENLGYQIIDKTENYNIGDTAIYVPTDSQMPVTEQYKFLEQHKYRVKAIKLRKIYSQGLLLKNNQNWPIGYDCSKDLGITKWEMPTPIGFSGKAKPWPNFIEKYDIENILSYPNLFVDKENVIVTEKVHGTNFTFGWFNEEFFVCSRSFQLEEDNKNVYWKCARQLDLKNKILTLSKQNIAFRGEIYGIQDLKYGKNPNDLGLVIFDIFKENKYISMFDRLVFCNEYNLLANPILYQGEFNLELIKHTITDKRSKLDNNTILEGGVIEPLHARFDYNLGRWLKLKFLNPAYLCRKEGTEFH